jgi:hypothetical protein
MRPREREVETHSESAAAVMAVRIRDEKALGFRSSWEAGGVMMASFSPHRERPAPAREENVKPS